jgi:hypothetical protein
MTDYSWLEPMERRTREIREETQRMKDEIEKMKQESHNLPVPDDAPWMNLKERSARILSRYNDFYNTECSGLTWGTSITPEFQQAMTLECMLDALRYENLNHEFDAVSTADINALIEGLYQQGKDYLEKVRKLKGEDK